MAVNPDSHDLDKLARWHEGLTAEDGNRFPVCAVFLVSGGDRRAHDIFRLYRTAFEEMEAGFHDLVIFGQHGVSSTSEALVPGLGLTGLRIPSLVLISRSGPPVCHTAVLPAGVLADEEVEEMGDSVPWKRALETIRRAVGKGAGLSLDGLEGLEMRDFPGGTLAEAVERVKVRVERPGPGA